MKRMNILPFLTILLVVIACSKSSIEDKAKSHLREMTEIVVNDPKSLIIQDEQVVFSNDSMCIINYLAKSKNKIGGYATSRQEYFYVHTYKLNKDSSYSDYHGSYSINNKEQSILEKANWFVNSLSQEEIDKYGGRDSLRNVAIRTYVLMSAISSGRKVETP